MAEKKRSLGPLAIVLILSGAFFALFLIVSGMLFLSNSPGSLKGTGGSSLFGGGAVGVVEINGVIMDSKKTLARLERFEENEQVKGVVLRLNSPGGAVAPSQEIYEAVRNYKKPLVVSMGTVAASGAYYIASGAKKIFANPGTMTGSIGVIMEFANLEKLYDWAKIQRYVVKTGRYKDIGAEFRAMSHEEKALIQSMVDDVLLQFKTAIVQGRKLSMAEVNAVADGRIFSGSQAKAAHLIDELGTLKDAVKDVARQAGIKGKPNVVFIDKQKRGLLDLLVDDSPLEGADGEVQSSRLVSQLVYFFQKLAANEGVQLRESVPGLYWVWGGGLGTK